jgi:hypothetical protein
MKSIEPRWNDTDREKPKKLGEKPASVPLCTAQSHMDWPGLKPGLRGERLAAIL